MSQKVLVAGTGISGIAAAKLLLAQGGEVVLYDGNEKLSAEELKKNFDEGAKVSVILGELKKLDLSGVELCVISPGISLEAPFVAVLDEARVPILERDRAGLSLFPGKAHRHHRNQRKDHHDGPDWRDHEAFL